MSGVNKFSGEGQGKIHHVVVTKEKVAPFLKKKVVTSEKVTPNYDVEKVTNILNDMEEPLVTILSKDLDNFEGQYTGSTSWFNLDNEWLKIKFSKLELYLYKKLFENDIEGQDIKAYKNFAVPFDNTKLNLSMHNESVKPSKHKKIASDDEEEHKDS